MDRGAWRAAVHGVAELDTIEQLTHTHMHARTHTHRESIIMAVELRGQWLSAKVSDLAGLVWGQQSINTEGLTVK